MPNTKYSVLTRGASLTGLRGKRNLLPDEEGFYR
jgi:hypothetical protein